MGLHWYFNSYHWEGVWAWNMVDQEQLEQRQLLVAKVREWIAELEPQEIDIRAAKKMNHPILLVCQLSFCVADSVT